MDKVVRIIVASPKGKAKHDDEFTDRLSHRYTTLLLVVFCLVVSMTAYVGTPIVCWAPKHFTGSHTKYANSYCWVRNTYYLPFEDEIPKEWENDKRHTILYYQWVPFILLAQAVCFYMPSVVWHGLNQKSGVDADNILDSAATLQRTNKVEARERTLMFITNQMDRFLGHVSRGKGEKKTLGCSRVLAKLFFCCGKGMGNYMIILFIISKMMYIANVIAQLFILNHLFQTDYNVFGYQVLNNLIHDRGWGNSETFPRVTMCDFKVRRLGNIQRYTVQCVLPINLYTEKMYAFLWFWMVLLAILSSMSLVVWILRTIMKSDQIKFIENHLETYEGGAHQGQSNHIREFVYDYLRQDGVFLIRLMSHNTSALNVTEIVISMYENWQKNRKEDFEKHPRGIDQPDAPPMEEDDDDDIKKPLGAGV